MRRILLLAALAPCVAGATCMAQAGPPFRTDDPETPGAGRWEINFGYIADRNPGAGNYQLPDFDINYGLGDRIQLKYELPIALAEQRPQGAQPEAFSAGLGNSLLGVKWRFYEHKAAHQADQAPAGSEARPDADPEAEPVVNFSISTYPQLSLANPTTSIARSVVPPGPDFLLPLEANARLGPIRVDAEIGYHFGNHALAQSWIRGLIVGHEFSERTELYLEIYDQQDANRVTDLAGDRLPKQRESTLGAGGRQALNRQRSLLLLFMGGRSFQSASSLNSQPSFIAYMGLQLLLGKEKHDNPQVEKKLPDEDPPKP